MRALLRHLAICDEADPVSVADRGEAMRNDNSRAPLRRQQLVECGLHHLLTLVVQRARRLVQQQHSGLGDDGAGDGDALLLPARELATSLAHIRLIALVQGADERVRVGETRGLLDLCGSRLRTVEPPGDVREDGAQE